MEEDYTKSWPASAQGSRSLALDQDPGLQLGGGALAHVASGHFTSPTSAEGSNAPCSAPLHGGLSEVPSKGAARLAPSRYPDRRVCPLHVRHSPAAALGIGPGVWLAELKLPA